MLDIQKYLSSIDQEHYDKWLEGRYSVADLVEKHKMVALIFRKKILNAIEDHEPNEIMSIFKKECPEIDIKDKDKALDRIENEFKEIKDIL